MECTQAKASHKISHTRWYVPIFFENYWDIAGSKVINCVLNALNSRIMPCVLNDTYICLIPKVKSPQKITKFRPINLCNVIYKLISKTLANRLKRILAKVIDESQSAREAYYRQCPCDHRNYALHRPKEEGKGSVDGDKAQHELGL